MATNNAIDIPKENMQRPFTLLIAASNSSTKGKEMADYTCDGTADESEINTAIASLSSGGEVHLLEGTYYIASTITMASNVKLSGCGNGTILKIPNSNNSSMSVITATAINFQVSDLQIDGNKTNNSSGTQNGISFSINTSIPTCYIIDKIYVHDMRNYGLVGGGTEDYYWGGTISNCFITNCGSDGIQLGCQGNIIGNILVNNTGWGINNTPGSGFGICANAVGNYAHNNTAGGIQSYNCKNNCVVTNQSTSGTGIRSFMSSGNFISGYATGISGRMLSCVGNRITCGSVGISSEGSQEGAPVSNNQIYLTDGTTQTGIYLYNSAYVNCIGNGIYGSGGSDITKTGIHLLNPYCAVKNNYIYMANTGNCVLLGASAGGSDIQGNTFTGATTGINNSAGASSVRALNNTGRGITTMISGSVANSTCGNTII